MGLSFSWGEAARTAAATRRDDAEKRFELVASAHEISILHLGNCPALSSNFGRELYDRNRRIVAMNHAVAVCAENRKIVDCRNHAIFLR